MQLITDSTFDHATCNLTRSTCRLTVDGVKDKCDISISCVEATVDCDAGHEPNWRIGQDISDEVTIRAQRRTAPDLPEDTTGRGAVCQ